MANYSAQYTFGVRAETKSAQSSLNALSKSLRSLQSQKYSVNVDKARIEEASKAAEVLHNALQNAMNVNTGNLDLTKFNNSLKQAGTSVGELGQSLLNAGTQGQQAFTQLVSTITKAEMPVKQLSKTLSQMGTTLMNTIKWQASSSLIHGLMSSISGAISYAKNLNSTLNDIRIVTGASIDEMTRFAETANKAAKALSTSTNDFAKASLIYYQQGDSAELAAKKAEITTKAANVAFTASAREMSEMLTAVWNSYQVGEEQLEHTVDILAKLGATTASSMEEMATGMQKVAATAHTVGISIEQMSAMIATSASVTRQAPQTIGTAWNTILNRISGLKLGETLEDGVDLNKYSKALQTIGVNILDAAGNLKDMGGVVDEIGAKWDNLNKAQQTALAQTIGGVRQYTQIMAFFENFDKYQKNLQTANTSDGALQEQQETYAQSWEAASKRVQAAMETVYSQLINDQAITKLTSFFAQLINFGTNLTSTFGGLGNVINMVVTSLISANIDRVSTSIQEAGTSIKQLFSGSQEIENYKNSLTEVREQLQSLADRDDISSTQSTQLQYDIQILSMKEKLASVQDTLTAKQKQEAAAIIEKMEASKAYYAEIMAHEEQLAAKQKSSHEDVAAQVKANVADYTINDTQRQKGQYDINAQRMNTIASNIGLGELASADEELQKAYDHCLSLAKALGVVKKDAERITVEELITSLEKASQEAGKFKAILSQTATAFNGGKDEHGNQLYDINAYTGSAEQRKSMLVDMGQQVLTSSSPLNAGALTAKYGEDLSGLASIDPSNTTALQEALNLLVQALTSCQGEASKAATEIGNFTEQTGATHETVEQLKQDAEQVGESTLRMSQDAKKTMLDFSAEFDKGISKASKGVSNFVKGAMTLSRISSALQAVGNAWNTLKDPNASGWQKVTTVMSTLVTVAMAASSVMSLLNAAQAKNATGALALAMAKTKETYSSIMATAAEAGHTGALVAVSAGFKAAAAGALEFMAALGPIGWIALALMAVAAVIGAIVGHLNAVEAKWQEEMTEKQNALKESMEETRVASQKLQSDLQTLGDIMHDTSLTYDEQLSKINEICAAYGVQATALDVLSGNYAGLAQQMRAAAEAEITGQLNTARQNLSDASSIARQLNSHNNNGVLAHGSEGALWWANATKQGITYQDGQYAGQGTFKYAGEADALKSHESELKALGFNLYGNGELKSTYKADYAGLLELIETNDDLLAYVSKQNSYLNGISQGLYTNGYGDVRAARKQVHDIELQSNLIHNQNFDMFDTSGVTQTAETVSALLNATGASGATDRSNLLNYLSGFSAYETIAPQMQALNTLTQQAASLELKLNPDIQISKTELEDQIWTDLQNTGLDVDTILYVHATDVVLDDDGHYTIDEEARKLAEARAKTVKAQTRQATLQENQELMTGDSFTKEDFTTLWETGLFETQEALQEFMHNGKATRTAIWQTFYDDALEAEAEGLEAAIAQAQEKQPELEAAVDAWYTSLASKASGLTFLSSKMKGKSGAELYDLLNNERWNRQTSIDENQAVIDEYNELMNNSDATDDQKKAFMKKYNLGDNWDADKARSYIGGLQEKIGTAEAEVAALNEVLGEGDILIGQMSENAQLIATSLDQQAALEFYTEWTANVTKATKASEAFAEAIGQSGKMTAEALADLQQYDEEALTKYTELSSEDWDKYAYTKAVEYYDQLMSLYNQDTAEYIAAQQAKKSVTETYNNQIIANAQTMVDEQISQWEKIRTAAENSISSIESMLKDVSKMDFVSMEKLKQNLLDAGIAMEDIVNLFDTLTNPNSTDVDKVVAAATAQGKAALEELTTLYKQKEQYDSLSSKPLERTTVIIDSFYVDGKQRSDAVAPTYASNVSFEIAQQSGITKEQFSEIMTWSPETQARIFNLGVKLSEAGVDVSSLSVTDLVTLANLPAQKQKDILNAMAKLNENGIDVSKMSIDDIMKFGALDAQTQNTVLNSKALLDENGIDTSKMSIDDLIKFGQLDASTQNKVFNGIALLNENKIDTSKMSLEQLIAFGQLDESTQNKVLNGLAVLNENDIDISKMSIDDLIKFGNLDKTTQHKILNGKALLDEAGIDTSKMSIEDLVKFGNLNQQTQHNVLNGKALLDESGIDTSKLSLDDLIKFGEMDRTTQHKVLNGQAILTDSGVELKNITIDQLLFLSKMKDQGNNPTTIINALAKLDAKDFNTENLDIETLKWMATLPEDQRNVTVDYILKAGVEGFNNLEQTINDYLDTQDLSEEARQVEFNRLMSYAIMNFDTKTLSNLTSDALATIKDTTDNFSIDIYYTFQLDPNTGVTIAQIAQTAEHDAPTVNVPVNLQLSDEVKALLGLSSDAGTFSSDNELLDYIALVSKYSGIGSGANLMSYQQMSGDLGYRTLVHAGFAPTRSWGSTQIGADELRDGLDLVMQYLNGMIQISDLNDAQGDSFSQAKGAIDTLFSIIQSSDSQNNKMNALTNFFKALEIDLNTGTDELKAQLENSGLYDIGRFIILGIVAGLKQEGESIDEAIERLGLGETVLAKLCEVFDIHSPSKLTQYIGEMIVKGINVGMDSTKLDFSNLENHILSEFSHLKAIVGTKVEDLTPREVAFNTLNNPSETAKTDVGAAWQSSRVLELQAADSQLEAADAQLRAANEWAAMTEDQQNAIVTADQFIHDYLSSDSDLSYAQDDSLDIGQKATMAAMIAAAQETLHKEDSTKEWSSLTGTEQLQRVTNEFEAASDTIVKQIQTTWQSLKNTWETSLTSIYSAEQSKAQEVLDLWLDTFDLIAKGRVNALKGDSLISSSYKNETDMTNWVRLMREQGITDTEQMWKLLSATDYDTNPQLQKLLSLNDYNLSNWLTTSSAVGNAQWLKMGPSGYEYETHEEYERRAREGLTAWAENSGDFKTLIVDTMADSINEYNTLKAKSEAGIITPDEIESLSAVTALLESLRASGLVEFGKNGYQVAEKAMSGSLGKDLITKFVEANILKEDAFYNYQDKMIGQSFTRRETLATQFESEQATMVSQFTDQQALVKKALEKGAENLTRDEQDQLLNIMEEDDISALTGAAGIQKLQAKNIELGESADAASEKVSALAEAIRQGFSLQRDENGQWVATKDGEAVRTAATNATLSLFGNSNVDLLNRPQIDASKLTARGWDDAGTGIATVFSSTYTPDQFELAGQYAVNVTPILPDGSVLSPDELDEYVGNIFEQANGDLTKLMELDQTANGGKGLFIGAYDNLTRACDAAETLHELQEDLYLTDETQTLTEEEIQERYGNSDTHYAADAREFNSTTQSQLQSSWLSEVNTDLSTLDTLQKAVGKGTEDVTSQWLSLINTLDMADPKIAAAVQELENAVALGEDTGDAWNHMTDAILQHGDVLLEDSEELQAYLNLWYKQYEITDANGKALNAASLNMIRYGKAAKTFVSALTKVNKSLGLELGTMQDLRQEAKKAGKTMSDFTKDIEDLTDAEREMIQAFDDGYDSMDNISEVAGSASEAFSNFDDSLLDAAVNCETVEAAADLFADNFITSLDNLTDASLFDTAATNFFANADNFKNGAISKMQEMGIDIPENMNLVWEAIEAAGGNLATVDWGTLSNTMGVDLSWILNCLQAIIAEYSAINGLDEFDLSAVIAAMQSAYNNTSSLQSRYGGSNGGTSHSVNNNTPSSSSSSGSSSNDTSKTIKQYKKGADEKERYHEIRDQLEKQGNLLEKIDKLKTRTYGAKHLKNIENEIAALERENELQEQYLAEAQVNLDANRRQIESVFGKGAFNDDGTLNYQEYMDKILAEYNAAVDAYNASDQDSGDTLALNAAEERYNELKKLLEDYEEDLDLVDTIQNDILENQNKISAAALEGIQYKVTIVTELNDQTVKGLEYWQDLWEDTLDKAGERMVAFSQTQGAYMANLNSLQAEYNELMNDTRLNDADRQAGLEELNSEILKQLEELDSLQESMKSLYGDTLELADTELEKYTSKMKHAYDVMSDYIKMQQLMGLGEQFKDLSPMYEMQLNSSMASVRSAKEYLDILKEQKARIEANAAETGWTDTLKQQWDDVEEHIKTAEDNLLQYTDQALNDAKNIFENSIKAAIKDFDEGIKGLHGSLTDLENDYAYYQEEQGRYLGTVKELFEIQKLTNKIDNSIADSTTSTSKQRLSALKEEIKAMHEKRDLTEYDLKMMELQYKHALALDALEQQKNAKSVVRLTRDENGNYGYQYTANEDDINKAQQDVDDALQSINELAANRTSEIEQKVLQIEREYRDNLLTIASDTTMSIEQRQERMNELTKQHQETLKYYQEQYGYATAALFTNQEYVAERFGTTISDVRGQYNADMMDMIASTEDYAKYLTEQMTTGEIASAFEKFKQDTGLVLEATGFSSNPTEAWGQLVDTVDGYQEAVEQAEAATHDINQTLEQQGQDIADVTLAWAAFEQTLDSVRETYLGIYQAAVQAQQALGGVATDGNGNTTGVDAGQDDGDTSQTPGLQGKWQFSWSGGTLTGNNSGYDSKEAAKDGALQDIAQKFQNLRTEEDMDVPYAWIAAARASIRLTKYAHGGLIDFTGPAWVDGSSDMPESILNAQDTENMLQIVNTLHSLDTHALLNSITQGAIGMLYSLNNLSFPSGVSSDQNALEQHVQITAEFPNATDHNEIEQAFNDIINLASQYANRR